MKSSEAALRGKPHGRHQRSSVYNEPSDSTVREVNKGRYGAIIPIGGVDTYLFGYPFMEQKAVRSFIHAKKNPWTEKGFTDDFSPRKGIISHDETYHCLLQAVVWIGHMLFLQDRPLLLPVDQLLSVLSSPSKWGRRCPVLEKPEDAAYFLSKFMIAGCILDRDYT